MAKEKLNARKVANFTEPGRYGDGGGLWLQISKWGTKAWVFQFTSPTAPRKKKIKYGQEVEVGQVRQLGLGSLHTVSLAKARTLAAEKRVLVTDGIDPIEETHEARQTKRLARARTLTFRNAAMAYMEAHRADWKNPKHAAQWSSTLENYAYPVIGDLSVAAVDTSLVRKVLEPIWTSKPETASRLRGRIEAVLDYAKAAKARDGENPARWKDNLKHLLPNNRRSADVQHHPAMPYAELAAFLPELRSKNGISPRALEFAILTAARTGEVIGATWDEIDLAAKLWTIPGRRMKAGKEHRVPLSDRAVAILKSMPREDGNSHVFVGGKAGQPLSNMAMLETLRDLRPGLTVHGFRSSFSDWAHEQTAHADHTIEISLAHNVGTKVEQAYRRGDLFEKRRRLMTEWTKYCSQKPTPVRTNNVTRIRAVARVS